jgi:hypothetical protein
VELDFLIPERGDRPAAPEPALSGGGVDNERAIGRRGLDLLPQYSWMRMHAIVFVVRKKQLVSVLHLGIGVQTMDWAAHHLDLTLAFEPAALR